MEFKESSSREAEINGDIVTKIIEALGPYKTKGFKILIENGILKPQPGKWYNQQAWLNAFNTIATQLGGTVLFAVGQKIPEYIDFPDEIKDIHHALSLIDLIHKMNFRNGDLGGYGYKKTGERTGQIICTTPYPDNFDKGIIITIARKYKPDDFSLINIEVDANMPVRSMGGDSTTFILTW